MLLVVPLLLIVVLAVPALCIWAAVDASSQPEWAFESAQTSKTLWVVLPIVGLFFCIVGLIVSIMWFSTFKPRVENAARGGSGFPPRMA